MIQTRRIAAIMFTDFAGCISFLKGETKHALLFVACFFFLSSALGQSFNLFDTDEVMEFTLRCDLKTVFKDRGDDPQYHPASLHYQVDQNAINIPIQIKTRGHFRKMSSNCTYPPLLLNFANSYTPENSVFYGQDKVKLVTPPKKKKSPQCQ